MTGFSVFQSSIFALFCFTFLVFVFYLSICVFVLYFALCILRKGCFLHVNADIVLYVLQSTMGRYDFLLLLLLLVLECALKLFVLPCDAHQIQVYTGTVLNLNFNP